MRKSIIRSTGKAVPSRVVTNDDLAKFLDITDEWIQQRTGIEQRYWVLEDEEIGASDLGLEASLKALDQAGWKLEDVDLIIPHQANLRINQTYCELLKLDQSKMFNNIQKYGNTTAATIPIALEEAMDQNLIGKSGDIVMFTGLGAGITWGGVLYKFP